MVYSMKVFFAIIDCALPIRFCGGSAKATCLPSSPTILAREAGSLFLLITCDKGYTERKVNKKQ